MEFLSNAKVFLIHGPMDELSMDKTFKTLKLLNLNILIKSSVISSPASAYTSPVFSLIMSSAKYFPISSSSYTDIDFRSFSNNVFMFLYVILSPALATTLFLFASTRSKLSL